MSDIKIYPVGMNEAEDISGYLMPEVETALKKGLPVTAYAAACDGTIAGAALAARSYRLLFGRYTCNSVKEGR